MYKFFLSILILGSLQSGTLWASNPETQPETQPAPIVLGPQEIWGGGKVLFFPEQSPRPKNDQFPVKVGADIPLCLTIESRKSPVIERVLQEATQFRLVLEDSQTPPNAIVVTIGDGKNPLLADAKGCYVGEFKIPPQSNQGVYQVANLFFRTRRRNFVSLHQVLFNFSQADELKIENPNDDTQAPSLIGISTFDKSIRMIDGVGNFEDIRVTQKFTFNEEGSGVVPETLKVFYTLREEGQQMSIHAAQCKRIPRTKVSFRCSLKLIRPDWQWEFSNVSLELQSLYLEDKAGNLLVLQEPAVFQEAAKGSPIKFEFRPDVKGLMYKTNYQRPTKKR